MDRELPQKVEEMVCIRCAAHVLATHAPPPPLNRFRGVCFLRWVAGSSWSRSTSFTSATVCRGTTSCPVVCPWMSGRYANCKHPPPLPSTPTPFLLCLSQFFSSPHTPSYFERLRLHDTVPRRRPFLTTIRSRMPSVGRRRTTRASFPSGFRCSDRSLAAGAVSGRFRLLTVPRKTWRSGRGSITCENERGEGGGGCFRLTPPRVD